MRWSKFCLFIFVKLWKKLVRPSAVAWWTPVKTRKWLTATICHVLQNNVMLFTPIGVGQHVSGDLATAFYKARSLWTIHHHPAGRTSKRCCHAGTRKCCDHNATVSLPAFAWTRVRLHIFPNSVSSQSINVLPIYSAFRTQSSCFVSHGNRWLFPRGWTGHSLKLTAHLHPPSRIKLQTFSSLSSYVIECVITLCLTFWRPREVIVTVALPGWGSVTSLEGSFASPDRSSETNIIKILIRGWCLSKLNVKHDVDNYFEIFGVTAWTLKMGPIGCTETSVTASLRCVTSEKSEDIICTAAEAWNHA